MLLEGTLKNFIQGQAKRMIEEHDNNQNRNRSNREGDEVLSHSHHIRNSKEENNEDY